MKNIAIIFGSSRPSVAGKAVATWFNEAASSNEDVKLDLIDLAEVSLPLLSEPMPPMMQQYQKESSKAWSKKISGYDAFIFVTAEYNGGYTAILKNAIDTLYKEWTEKPAAVISYGAAPASQAAEQLKAVLERITMKPAQKTLHVTPIHEAVSEDGVLDDSKVTGDTPTEIVTELAGML